jgi:hypothetical protein
MTLPKPLALADLDDFRRAIGLRAVVVNDDEFALDDDVDLTDPEITKASVALELGKVEAAKLLGEAQLRDWKAKAANALLAKEPKLAEWKVRARLEAEPRWLEAKAKLAELEAVRLTLATFATARG